MFQASFHTRVTLRASYYAPPDTGVPNLQLVALEYLEERAEQSPAPTERTVQGFPYEGKLSPEGD